MNAPLMSLEKFIDQLIAEKFGEAMPGGEALTQIKAELSDRLNQYITLRTIEAISQNNPEVIPELEALIKTNPTTEAVNAFISSRVEQPDVLVAQILTDFRSLYVGDTEKATN